MRYAQSRLRLYNRGLMSTPINPSRIALAPVAIVVLAVAYAASTATAAPPGAPGRKAAPLRVVTPEAAKSNLIGTWDATPALDEITLMAMDQVQDPALARMRAIGQRVIYSFGPGPAMRVVIVSRKGPENDRFLDGLKPRPFDARWDVVNGPKGLVLKVTPTKGGQPMEQPLTFDGDDAFTVETDLIEHEGFRPVLQFRRNIGDRVVRWLKANNAVGGDKSPMAADLGKAIAPFVARGDDFRIRLGPGLMTSGRATELFAIAEQLVVHELTAAEAARLKINKMGATTARWESKDAFPVLTEATASAGPEFDTKGGRIDLRKPITGTVTYAAVNRLPRERDATYLVRVSMVIGDQMIRAYHRSVSPRPGAAEWKFSVNPPADLADYAGPVHLFVDLCRETKFAHGDLTLEVLSPVADARFQVGK